MPFNLASIYIKCLAILVISCGVLAATVSYLGDRAARNIAESGVQLIAEIKTADAAEQLYGAVRFRKTEDIGKLLEPFRDVGNGLSEGVLVIDRDGQPMASLGEGSEDVTALQAAAPMVLESGEPWTSADGSTLAFPITGPDGVVVGAIASGWTTEPMIAAIARHRTKQIYGALGALAALILTAAIVIRTFITAPVSRLQARARDLASGDLESEVPETASRSEVGGLAGSIEALRTALLSAEGERQTAFLRSSGFTATSSAALMCDSDFRITFANTAFGTLAATFQQDDEEDAEPLDDDALLGQEVSAFYADMPDFAAMPDSDFPHVGDIKVPSCIVQISAVPLKGPDGRRDGYVMEWKDVTSVRKTGSILSALAEGQLQADFDAEGRLTSANDLFRQACGIGEDLALPETLSHASHDTSEPPWETLRAGHALTGRFTMAVSEGDVIVEGSISPVRGVGDNLSGFVLIGANVTDEARRLEEAGEANARMAAAQQNIVREVRSAMSALSGGDLRYRIETVLDESDDALREDFNRAVRSLDEAIGQILEASDTIQAEAESVSSAADAFSQRTEQQAATLEETSAAIAQLTASVESAAQGAKRANGIVTDAREAAASSGSVVQETVEAMGEIERSSEQISRIIGVIDEIAFQTNLLALNAGVEAARAGDAGRGFAVVASEVRALAQRSSEAAREISDLISTSGEQVKKGVSLVDRAGDALTGIAGTIGTVAEHVSEIAASAREQAIGVAEINEAMGRLDQVTQQNVAMFEETMAASQTLKAQAVGLVGITRGFRCSGSAHTPETTASRRTSLSSIAKTEAGHAAPDRSPTAHRPSDTPRPAPQPAVTGNLAHDTDIDEEDWKEF